MTPTPTELGIRCAQAGLPANRYLIQAGDYVYVEPGTVGPESLTGSVIRIEESNGILAYIILVDDVGGPQGGEFVSAGDTVLVPINGWPISVGNGIYWSRVTKL
jgi:hypothetical protein